jgi:osomolarity two-component system sensor histidine kinase NIK1
MNDCIRSLTKTIDAEVDGEMAVLKEAINDMVYKLRLFSSEVTRVSLDVGTRGQLGGQAVVTGVEGTWRTRVSPFHFLL